MTRVCALAVGTALMILTSNLATAQQAPPPRGLAEGLKASYAQIKANLTEAAGKLGDADYAFTPNPEIRSYGGQLGHVADAQFSFCAAASGAPNPMQGQSLEKKTSKAEIVKGLNDSFEFCDKVFNELTDANATQLMTQGRGQVARGAILTNVIAHDNEEYGIITVYLRLKAMVPPSTERAQRGRRGQ